jgi:hypothetical protein
MTVKMKMSLSKAKAKMKQDALRFAKKFKDVYSVDFKVYYCNVKAKLNKTTMREYSERVTNIYNILKDEDDRSKRLESQN